MGNTRGKPAQRRQLFGADQLRLHSTQISYPLGDHVLQVEGVVA